MHRDSGKRKSEKHHSIYINNHKQNERYQMKVLITALFLFALFISFSASAYAQEAQNHVVVMTNFERAFPDKGTAAELDSLAQIMMENSYKNNPYVLSYKVVRHFWGHDSRDFIQMITVKSFEDINKAEDEGNKAFMKAMPEKADRQAFNKAFTKYFTGKQSDEIYSEVASSQK